MCFRHCGRWVPRRVKRRFSKVLNSPRKATPPRARRAQQFITRLVLSRLVSYLATDYTHGLDGRSRREPVLHIRWRFAVLKTFSTFSPFRVLRLPPPLVLGCQSSPRLPTPEFWNSRRKVTAGVLSPAQGTCSRFEITPFRLPLPLTPTFGNLHYNNNKNKNIYYTKKKNLQVSQLCGMYACNNDGTSAVNSVKINVGISCRRYIIIIIIPPELR